MGDDEVKWWLCIGRGMPEQVMWLEMDRLQKKMVLGFLTRAEGRVLSKMEIRVGADLREKIKGSDLGMPGLDAIR